jgi:diadenylate cyclase
MWPVIHWQLVADFLALCFALYALLWWARSARAMRIVLAIVGLRALSLLTLRLNMVIASWILNGAAILAILVLFLVFQPELRRVFTQIDSALRHWPHKAAAGSHPSQAIAAAAFELAKCGLGALFVIVRRDAINALLEGGVALGADISPELLVAIFQKLSPLHDGAAIIVGNKILQTNVVLPLTRRKEIPAFYGTRHRAAIGLAERCDALVVVVSEERSEVTLMDGDKIRPIAHEPQLAATLDGYLSPPQKTAGSRWHSLFAKNLDLKFAAVGLAALIWGMSFLASGSTIRTVSVPIEFSNVPSGMVVAYQSADTLAIQVQGSPWILDTVSLAKLVGQFNLQRAHPGWYSLRFDKHSLNLPPGLNVDRVTPSVIRIQVAPISEQGSATPR